ncbi:hypothetical protein [Sanguibacter sp. HDW7]|uniref:hypothetical protein n=1 Tax=Sanguibacter sp. HDW7 TaxID=2714931 RepID=UPI00140D898C|nr:hypothetical protein [Sanguibacter sp. HDW7]QIK82542.1 hypothetical protein G7063_02085 [Sanguibacter sp. HDW7]
MRNVGRRGTTGARSRAVGAAALLALAAGGLAACTPAPTPTAPTPVSTTPAPTVTTDEPSTDPETEIPGGVFPGFPTDEPTVEPEEPLRWADGSEIEGTLLDTGTARRLGPDALTVLRELESPEGLSLNLLDVAVDGTVLVSDVGEQRYVEREDGSVTVEATEGSVVRVVGPRGEKVLTSPSKEPEETYSGLLLPDGSAVWFGSLLEESAENHVYRAPAGSTKGAEVTGGKDDGPDGFAGYLDDGIVLRDGRLRAWDGTTRTFIDPLGEGSGVQRAGCAREECPLIREDVTFDDDAAEGDATGYLRPAHTTVSFLEDGASTPVLTYGGGGSVVGAYEQWIVVANFSPESGHRTWILDTSNRTARYLADLPSFALAGPRLVWGTYQYNGELDDEGGDVHVLDVRTGDLARIVVDEAVGWPRVAGDIVAWTRQAADGSLGRTGAVARFGKDVP